MNFKSLIPSQQIKLTEFFSNLEEDSLIAEAIAGLLRDPATRDTFSKTFGISISQLHHLSLELCNLGFNANPEPENQLHHDPPLGCVFLNKEKEKL